MKTSSLKKVCLTSALALLTCGTLRAQTARQINGADAAVAADETGDASAPDVIFSNIGPKDDRYFNTFFPAPIVGKGVRDVQEQWDAMQFVPKVDAQASVLEAAVQYVGGTRIVRLGIFDNSGPFGHPGMPLAGAQGTTTHIPSEGECCQLAKVVFHQPVMLKAGTIYWLVARPDNARGPDFNGVWQVSHVGDSAFFEPARSWVHSPGEWPAARIRGTTLQTLGPVSAEKQSNAQSDSEASVGGVTIFSNLDPVFSQPYTTGVGEVLIGNDVQDESEVWEALPFTPKSDVRAKTIKAAIAHNLGYPTVVDLGIYTDNGGVPDASLPGGQGIATDVPASGQCCDFATARLPGKGVALSGGVQYWLVAKANKDAEKFAGIWQYSNQQLLGSALS